MKPESYARLMQADAEIERRRKSEAETSGRDRHGFDPYNATGKRTGIWRTQAVRANASTKVSDTGLLRVLHDAFRNFRSSL
ncbi:MAG: hypothetical protein OEW35_12365 [Gammaproteobacteria bacterium]|nr:hypothetical protein [Gammaproteobacteria bacterium]MDH4255245.1 hypothetical protein [Gammaproteobacteria bacterium]MDH5310056.1 hypothetical protein [Gammaproteobacteria bacterium]